MKSYLIYYKRVYCGKTVSQGNMFKETENKITMEDLEYIYHILDNKYSCDSNLDIKQGVTIIVNIMEIQDK